MSNLYSKKNEHDLLDDHYRIGNSGAPLLRGALTSFECESWAYYDDVAHEIVVGRVIEMDNKPGAKPLVFQASKYKELR
jgi:flavin reductase (DIM6/NTAB) family NADH-FMN oxidoreductase RutF